MNRILLKNKQDGEEDEQETEQIDDQNDDTVKSESYQAALDQLLRAGRNPPRQIIDNSQTIQENTTETMEIDNDQNVDNT